MTFKVNLDLEHFWSITEQGELALELAPKNRPDDVKAEFTFNRGLLLDALNEDVMEKFKDPSHDMEEWHDLLSWLKGTVEAIEETLRESFE